MLSLLIRKHFAWTGRLFLLLWRQFAWIAKLPLLLKQTKYANTATLSFPCYYKQTICMNCHLNIPVTKETIGMHLVLRGQFARADKLSSLLWRQFSRSTRFSLLLRKHFAWAANLVSFLLKGNPLHELTNSLCSGNILHEQYAIAATLALLVTMETFVWTVKLSLLLKETLCMNNMQSLPSSPYYWRDICMNC